ncbi:DUF3737 family protein [Candidatus Woesearchaeota archaeon]|nr:DUF3737 family protein [Candidatus Woesearchaeota archaeon]
MAEPERKNVYLRTDRGKDNFLAREEGIKVVACRFGSDRPLLGSRYVFIDKGHYSGNEVAWQSEYPIASEAEFSGEFAFGRAFYPFVVDSTLSGDAAMYASQNALLVNNISTGRSLLEESVNAILIDGDVMGKNAFEKAENVQCYVRHISEINSPKSGFIVAESIDRIVSRGGSRIFAADVRQGSEYATIIPRKSLDRLVDPKNFTLKIREIVRQHGSQEDNAAYSTISDTGYWQSRVMQGEALIEAERKSRNEHAIMGLKEVLASFPEYKSLSEFVMNPLKMGKSIRAKRRFERYIGENANELREALYDPGNTELPKDAVTTISENLERLFRIRRAKLATFAFLTVVGWYTSPYTQNFFNQLVESADSRHIRNVREMMQSKEYDSALKLMSNSLNLGWAERRSDVLHEWEGYLNQMGYTLNDMYKSQISVLPGQKR